MKIAILTTIDVSMSWFLLPMAYKLKEKGIDVTLICHMSDEFYCKYSKDFKCINIDIERGFNLKKTIKNFFFFRKLFKKEKYDAIEYATDNVSFPCSIAARQRKIPIRILDAWGILFIAYSGLKRKITKFIEKASYKNSTHVRQVSEKNKEFSVANKLCKENKVVVLGKGGTIGVDINRFDVTKKLQFNYEIRKKYNIPFDSKLLGFVGRIQTDKGVNELIEAFELLYKDNNNLYLMLVGFIDTSNPIKKENMDWAKNCPNVIFTGRVSDTEKFISAFDFLVHPTYREGFGMVLQEAGAVKTPIITTNIIGPSEFITHNWNGLLVEPKDTQSLLNGISIYINNSDLAFKHAENCYKFTIENFERNLMIERMVEDRLQIFNKKK